MTGRKPATGKKDEARCAQRASAIDSGCLTLPTNVQGACVLALAVGGRTSINNVVGDTRKSES